MIIHGETALVTGGASGLGRATALALHAAGARVAIVDTNGSAAEVLAKEIDGTAISADVSRPDSFADAINMIEPFRICVHCAGIGPAKRILGRDGPMQLEDFTRVIEINLIGTFNVLRLAAGRMAGLSPLSTGERGVIINTASVAAFEGQIGQSAYAASKGGVAALTLPAARELAQFGIRVLAIAPGIFATPMLRALPEAAQAALGQAIPFPKRLGEPAEFAKLAIHMIENVMLNGTVVRIDGAIRLAPQ
ncbi:MAG: SDR family NAD(P)-dependent oxidoreductase [Proteobacteria bacterium]|nr:SDR family NAD(P)-dependent oxidoreductase [Pseudomonadota bacterium]